MESHKDQFSVHSQFSNHYLSKRRSNSSKESQTILYADDTVVSNKVSIETVGKNHDAAVASWFYNNKLTNNTTQTKHMVFGKGRKLEQHRTPIDRAEIEQAKSFRYLGLLLDDQLKFKDHINYVKEKQFGFRSKLSTVDAIASLTEEIRANWYKSKSLTKCTFIDLKKAFDTANHELLLKKCEHYGLRGTVLKMLESYLKDQLQFIKIGKVESEKKGVECGVPQGSILSPFSILNSLSI